MTTEREGKLLGELRAIRKKQARLRYQVRHQHDRLKRLRTGISLALTALDEGKPAAATTLLEKCLEFHGDDPDPQYTPAGAKKRRHSRK